MTHVLRINLALLALALVTGFSALATAADEPPPPQTIDDALLPVEELNLLLKPLTRSQLLVEADAWQGLLEDKAKEISALEILIKRGNRYIEDSDTARETSADMAEELKEAQAALDSAEEGETERAAKKAAKAEQKLAESLEDLSGTEEAKQLAQTAVEKADSLAEKSELLEKAADIAAERIDAGEEAKVNLLATLTRLREERAGLIDRLESVLDALDNKTDQGDADTLTKITDYRLYSRAVGGIDVDVEDTTSLLMAVKGWALSAEGGKRWAINLSKAIGTLLVAWIISGLFSSAIRHGLARMPGTSRLLENFLVKAVKWIIMAIGIIMALAAMEISVGPLLALLGAAGFVIAFALQDSLSNFASGLMILFFRPFDEGDGIDAGGVAGKVQSMNLVSTTILTFDNKRMIVPNNKIWNDVITNVTGVSERRVDMEFGIGYDDDIDAATEILNDIVLSHPKVLKDPEPTIRMHALADSSVNFIVRPWSLTEDYWDVNWDITRAVKKRFDAAGIGIPFPQRDVHLYLQEGKSMDEVLKGTSADQPAKRKQTLREDGGLDDGSDSGGDDDGDHS